MNILGPDGRPYDPHPHIIAGFAVGGGGGGGGGGGAEGVLESFEWSTTLGDKYGGNTSDHYIANIANSYDGDNTLTENHNSGETVNPIYRKSGEEITLRAGYKYEYWVYNPYPDWCNTVLYVFQGQDTSNHYRFWSGSDSGSAWLGIVEEQNGSFIDSAGAYLSSTSTGSYDKHTIEWTEDGEFTFTHHANGGTTVTYTSTTWSSGNLGWHLGRNGPPNPCEVDYLQELSL